MFGNLGQVEREMEAVHAATVNTRRAMPAPPSNGPQPVLPFGPAMPGPMTEQLLRRAYGLKDAPRGSRAEKVVSGAKIVGGGIVLGLTMLGGLYLSRKIAEWKKPKSERKEVEFLSFDWETIVPVLVAIALGGAAIYGWRRIFEEEQGTPALPPGPAASAPASSADPLDQMLAQAEADLKASEAPPIPALGV